MHELRLQIDEMQKTEHELLAERYDDSKSGLQLTMWSIFLPAAIGFGLMIVTYYLFQRNEKDRLRTSTILYHQKERLRTTLSSIGDGVITTDPNGNITNLNPVASTLTGWSNHEAKGKPLTQVFEIVNETTRQSVENPVTRSLREGTIVGLANHTILIARDRSERFIDDSASPIRGEDGKIVGSSDAS
jgi:PAS domain S-box-containing protein